MVIPLQWIIEYCFRLRRRCRRLVVAAVVAWSSVMDIASIDFDIKPFRFCFSPETEHGTTFSNFSWKFFDVFARAESFSAAQKFQILADSAAIRLVQKSLKSEPSSPFFGRLTFRESLSRTSSFKIRRTALQCPGVSKQYVLIYRH